MAKRTGKVRPRKPPVNRKRQRAATSALARKQPETIDLVSLAKIRELREKSGSAAYALAARTRLGISRPTQGEYGASGTLNVFGRIYNEDYNTLFDGKNGLIVFDQMDRSDGQVGAAADIIKLPLRAAAFRAEPPEDATQKEKDIADAVNASLFENERWPSGESWDFYLRHLLMRVTHGFGLVEKVWMFDEDDGLLRWKRLAPRLPKTVEDFLPNPDGSLRAIRQYVSMPGTGKYEHREIPAEYAVLSVREREGDNYFGRSIFRRIYKHWFYKDEAYRIDGIRLDRYGVGIPVAKIDATHVLDENELNEIELTLQALRSHERAYIVEPPDVTFRIMTPDNGQGGATGLMESVQHHDTMIVRGVLATFMSDHAEGLNTNRTRTLADIFLHSLKAEARAIGGDIQSMLVRPFCMMNFDMADARHPTVKVIGLGDMTMAELVTTIAPLVGAAITAEDELENFFRRAFNLPPLPEGWKRGAKKPPAPVAPNNNGGRDNDEPRLNEEEVIEASSIFTFAADRYVRDAKGKFAKGGGTKGSADKETKASAKGGSDVSTVEARINPRVSAEEAADPKFQSELKRIQENAANDPMVSDFERTNPVAAARASREAQRPFEEIHPGGSQAFHRDENGNYTAERQKIHDDIVGQYTSKFGPPQDRPEAVVLGGLAGAGKSETLNREVPDLDRFVNLSSDDVKGMLPEYNGVNAGWLHEESDHVAKIVLNKAVTARQNVIVDVTMKSVGIDAPDLNDGVGGQVRQLVNQGYDVKMKFIEIDLKQSGDAAMKRYVKKGRYVPPDYIRKARASDPSKSSRNLETFERLRDLPGVSGWTHLDRRNPDRPVRTAGGSN